MIVDVDLVVVFWDSVTASWPKIKLSFVVNKIH